MAKKSTTRRTSERLRRNDPDREAPLRRATRIMLSANNQNDKKTSADMLDSNCLTWLARRKRTASQSSDVAKIVMASSCAGRAA